MVPKVLHDRAIVYFDANKDQIENKRYLSVVDFSSRSKLARFHIIDMTTGKVVSLHVAHGKGSDPENTGHAISFGNTPNSLTLIRRPFEARRLANHDLASVCAADSRSHSFTVLM